MKNYVAVMICTMGALVQCGLPFKGDIAVAVIARTMVVRSTFMI